MRQRAVRGRLSRRGTVLRRGGEFGARVGASAVPWTRIYRARGSVLRVDVWIPVHVLRSLRGRLSLSGVGLVLCEMVIIRGGIVVRSLTLGLRRDETSVGPLRIGISARRGSHLGRRLPGRLGYNLPQRGIVDKARESPTVHGFVHFSPVMNGCILACCGVHRSMGFMFRRP